MFRIWIRKKQNWFVCVLVCASNVCEVTNDLDGSILTDLHLSLYQSQSNVIKKS